MLPDAYLKVTRCQVGIVVDAFGGEDVERPVVDALLASLSAAGVPTMSRLLPGRLYAGDERNVTMLADQVARWCRSTGIEVAVRDL